MPNLNNGLRLTSKGKRDLIIQAGIQAIPYVGGSLSTIYFGAKQERRFKRIENFYKEVAQDIEVIKEKIASLNEHDKEDALASISLIECDIIGYLFKENQLVQVEKIQIEATDQYAIVGATNRLKSYGFLSSSQIGLLIDDVGADSDYNLKGSVKITNYGIRFFEFCLKVEK